MSSLVITPEDEQRLRELASGVAKDIEDIPDLLKRLSFTMGDYEELCGTRMFRAMLDEAYNEWLGAGNTQKRVRLKAAINFEQALPQLYRDMTNSQEPLSSRVKVAELMMRAGNIGTPEPTNVGGGSAFNLTIQLNGDTRREMVISGSAIPSFPMGEPPQEEMLAEEQEEAVNSQSYVGERYSQLPMFDELPLEEF